MGKAKKKESKLEFGKGLFVSTIEAIRGQIIKDQIYQSNLKRTFKADEVELYDNSILVNQLLRILQEAFPPDEEGNCLIERFCWELDFGKALGAKVKTPGELFDYLMKEKKEQEDYLTLHAIDLRDVDKELGLWSRLTNEEIKELNEQLKDQENYRKKRPDTPTAPFVYGTQGNITPEILKELKEIFSKAHFHVLSKKDKSDSLDEHFEKILDNRKDWDNRTWYDIMITQFEDDWKKSLAQVVTDGPHKDASILIAMYPKKPEEAFEKPKYFPFNTDNYKHSESDNVIIKNDRGLVEICTTRFKDRSFFDALMVFLVKGDMKSRAQLAKHVASTIMRAEIHKKS